jgi:putative SOS response-associated peptidase YedK
MPVILSRGDYERWLDTSDADPADLLRPYPSDAMRAYPVSPRVNSPKNDDAELIEPLSP